MAITEASQHSRSQTSEAEECATESPVDAAEAAGLRYVTDRSPGIQRKRRGKHFSYLSPDGKVIQKPEVVERIQALKIPPAWKDVWICPRVRAIYRQPGATLKGASSIVIMTAGAWYATRQSMST